MGILVDRNTPPIAVKFGNEPDDGLEVNTVFVKAKLTLGDTINIEEGSYKMELAGDGSTAFRVPVSSIGQMVAALKVAVTGWSGPLFEGIKYRRSIWEEIDTSECEWWIRLVHKRVNEMNAPRTEEPKAPVPNAKE